MITAQDRFWSKVDFTDTCWLWTAYTHPDGYGRFRVGGFTQNAHRVAYEWVVGEIPEGFELDHLCRVRRCVRPEHLEAVTHAENMVRGDLSQNGEWQRTKTHCPQGHEYTDENTIIDNNRRRCRECTRARDRVRKRCEIQM